MEPFNATDMLNQVAYEYTEAVNAQRKQGNGSITDHEVQALMLIAEIRASTANLAEQLHQINKTIDHYSR